MKYILILLIATLHVFVLNAQSDQIFLEGENYISCQHAELKSRTDFTGLTSETFVIGQNPIQSYWFVTATDAHIVVYLSDGPDDDNRIFLELSRKKSSFNFPDDYSVEIGGYNDVSILVKGKDGSHVQLDPGKKSKLHVHVDLLDPLHLKISFDGVLSSRQLSSEAIPVNGKISLSSRSPLTQKLPDHYEGCDNTIYNTMSPGFDLGQWRSASACETSFHHKIWSTLNEALEPAITYLHSKQWLCEKVKENKVTRVRLQSENNFYNFRDFNQVFKTSYQINPSVMMNSGSTSHMLDLVNKMAALPMNPAPADSARVNRERDRLQKELTGFGNNINNNQQIEVEVGVNVPWSRDYPADGSQASVTKTAYGYLVENTTNPTWGYSYSGGTYILVGSWSTPEPTAKMVCTPELRTDGKKLSVQSLYIRLGCGQELAKEVIGHLDLAALRQMLQLTP